ncbi:hypothetical protein STEG23_019606 [Scotinomys teguina]
MGGRAGGLINSGTTQVQIQGYELAHPNIHSIYELHESVKGLVLQTQGCRISTTQGNNRISKRSPREDPGLMVYQKPEALNLNSEHLQVKMFRLKCLQCDPLGHTTASKVNIKQLLLKSLEAFGRMLWSQDCESSSTFHSHIKNMMYGLPRARMLQMTIRAGFTVLEGNCWQTEQPAL